jgi:hypothetical protein
MFGWVVRLRPTVGCEADPRRGSIGRRSAPSADNSENADGTYAVIDALRDLRVVQVGFANADAAEKFIGAFLGRANRNEATERRRKRAD